MDKSNIKICHLSSVHFALDTRIFYRMCNTLSKHYKVTLIAVHPQKEIKHNIQIIPFRRYHNRVFRVVFGWLIMFSKALKINAKIYHLHDPELIPCGLLLKLLGKKIIWDVHENIAEDIFDKPWLKNQKLAFSIFHFFEKKACKYFYLLLAEKSYEKHYKDLTSNYSIILNYCDLTFFKKLEQKKYDQGKNLFYIGIILENRGILQIIEAIHILNKQGEKFHFHCVGELYNDLYFKILNLPYYFEIKDQLHFYGRKSLEDGYALAKNMNIGLCIIWPMSNSKESYPTKLFEYMAIGLPIITSDFPLYKSVVEENKTGFCVNPFSATEIANAILNIHRDAEKSKQMAEKCKTIVENKYNWNSEISTLLNVYSQLLNITK